MSNMKKALSIFLALSMALGLSLPASAAPPAYKPDDTPIYTGCWDCDAIIARLIENEGLTRDNIFTLLPSVLSSGHEIDTDDIYNKPEDTVAIMKNRVASGRAALYSSFDQFDGQYYAEAAVNTASFAAPMARQAVLDGLSDGLSRACLAWAVLGQLGYENYIVKSGEGYLVLVFVSQTPYYIDASGRRMSEDDAAAEYSWDADFVKAVKDLRGRACHPYYYMGVDFSSAPPLWSKASAWAEPYLSTAQDTGLLPSILHNKDMTQPITREEFASLSVVLYEYISGRKAEKTSSFFTDCNSSDVLKAYSLGIVNGESRSIFNPSGHLLREQAAAMMGRTMEAVSDGHAGDGSELDTDGAIEFADDGYISAYAQNYVAYMSARGVINGVGGGRFDPQGVMTREAAVKVAIVLASPHTH